MDVYSGSGVTQYEDAEVKGRGNTTWGQVKKPYQIKFSKKVDLLGMGEAKKWVLLANYFDTSYIRNDVALLLAEMVGIEYNHRGEFVELYVDGDYRGLYYVVQKIEIAKGSVDLRNEGSALFEIDTLHKAEEECYTTYLGECLVLKDANFGEDTEDELIKKFVADLNEAEKAAENGDFEIVARILDVDSFVKYFLVNEFTVNPDAYTSSFYLYRNDAGKVAAGPVWDFDFALANRAWSWWTEETFFSPDESMIRKRNAFGHEGFEEDKNTSKMFYYLMDMPEFRNEVKRIFTENMSGRSREVAAAIDNRVERIYYAAINDGLKWDRDEFQTELKELKQWIMQRYKHFEDEYGETSIDRRMVSLQ